MNAKQRVGLWLVLLAVVMSTAIGCKSCGDCPPRPRLDPVIANEGDVYPNRD
jgi:hypothetical protein